MKTIELVVFTIPQLRTFIRKHTKKVGDYIELHSCCNTPIYATTNYNYTRIRKITRKIKNKYSCKVSYRNYNSKKYTTYESSCFMEEYQQDFGTITEHSLLKTINYLIEHDKAEDIHPYRIVIKQNNKEKSYNIFVKDFISRHDY